MLKGHVSPKWHQRCYTTSIVEGNMRVEVLRSTSNGNLCAQCMDVYFGCTCEAQGATCPLSCMRADVLQAIEK